MVCWRVHAFWDAVCKSSALSRADWVKAECGCDQRQDAAWGRRELWGKGLGDKGEEGEFNNLPEIWGWMPDWSLELSNWAWIISTTRLKRRLGPDDEANYSYNIWNVIKDTQGGKHHTLDWNPARLNWNMICRVFLISSRDWFLKILWVSFKMTITCWHSYYWIRAFRKAKIDFLAGLKEETEVSGSPDALANSTQNLLTLKLDFLANRYCSL